MIRENIAANIDTLFIQATREHQAGELDQAEQLYRKVLEIYPSHADCLHMLGLIEADKGHLGKALHLLEQAIKLNPDLPAFYLNRGLLHSRMKNFKEILSGVLGDKNK